MVSKKNYSDQETPSEIDTEYRDCNFHHDDAIPDGSGGWKGHRLFPGDDTPRTFINCNMVNCEPPPGSTLTGCNAKVIRRRVFVSSEPGVVVNGHQITTINHYNKIVIGKWENGDYTVLPSPKEYPFDEEV